MQGRRGFSGGTGRVPEEGRCRVGCYHQKEKTGPPRENGAAAWLMRWRARADEWDGIQCQCRAVCACPFSNLAVVGKWGIVLGVLRVPVGSLVLRSPSLYPHSRALGLA